LCLLNSVIAQRALLENGSRITRSLILLFKRLEHTCSLKMLNEEFWFCPQCLQEYTVYFENEEVVHRTKCGCKQEMKKLDEAFNELTERILNEETH